MLEIIRSTSNDKIKHMALLQTAKGRRAENAFPVEGEKMVLEALAAGLKAHFALVREDCAGLEVAGRLKACCPCYLCSAPAIARASDAVTPQGIIAAFSLPEPAARAHQAIVLLDGVQDPGNCGAIWRTCEAAGFDQIVFAGSAADPFSPKVVRASMGAVFRIPVSRAADAAQAVKDYRAQGYCVLASSLSGSPFFQRPSAGKRYVLVIGSEAHGVSQPVLDLADHVLRLPMAGKTESLNAAVAAGIMMYDLFLKEGKGGC